MSELLALAGGIGALFLAGMKFGPRSLRSQENRVVIIEREDDIGYEAWEIPEVPRTADEFLAACEDAGK